MDISVRMKDWMSPAGHIAGPGRPLAGGRAWRWDGPVARIYHEGPYVHHVTEWRFAPRRPGGRFDHHDPGQLEQDARAVLYAAPRVVTAICEAIAAHASVGSDGGRHTSVCARHRLAFLKAGTPVLLHDLVDDSAADLGAPDDLGDGPYHPDDTRPWGRAIYEDRPSGGDTAGIRYWSARHRDGTGDRAGVNIVVWEDAGQLHPVGLTEPLADSDLLAPTLDAAGIGFDFVDECGACRRRS